MPLLARMIHAPVVMEIRSGAVNDLAETLHDNRITRSGDVAVVIGPGIGPEIGNLVRRQLSRAKVIQILPGSLESAMALTGTLRGTGCDAVVGAGGGKVIDTAKYAASQLGLPMVSVATSLAHDGLCSPVSVLERQGETISYGVHIPMAVLVDLAYVTGSSLSQTQSGIGDALSNLCSVADWQLAHEALGEPIDGLALALARTGAQAVLNHDGDITSEDFLATLANALVLGGIAMAVAGSSRPCSGGCHEIAHAITHLFPRHGSHGQQVALGAFFCTFLRQDWDLFQRLNIALKRFDLPRTPNDLGLTLDQFTQAIRLAPSTRPGRYTILEHVSMDDDDAHRHAAAFADAVSNS